MSSSSGGIGVRFRHGCSAFEGLDGEKARFFLLKPASHAAVDERLQKEIDVGRAAPRKSSDGVKFCFGNGERQARCIEEPEHKLGIFGGKIFRVDRGGAQPHGAAERLGITRAIGGGLFREML